MGGHAPILVCGNLIVVLTTLTSVLGKGCLHTAIRSRILFFPPLIYFWRKKIHVLGPFIMYLNVECDDLYQKIARKLIFFSLNSIRINTVIHVRQISRSSTGTPRHCIMYSSRLSRWLLCLFPSS